MAAASGASAKLYLKKQTTHGVAATGNYASFPAESFRAGAAPSFLPNNLIGQGRDQGRPQRDISDANGQAVVPVDLRALPHWLAMTFGPPTTTGAGPYTHVFASGGSALTEYSIEQQHPDLASARYWMTKDVTADGFDLEVTSNGELRIPFDLSVGDQVPSASSSAGTPTETAIYRFSQLQSFVNLNGSALGKIVTCRLPYRNNPEKTRYIGGGGLVGDIALGTTESRGSLSASFSDMTLLNMAGNQDVFNLEVGFVDAAAPTARKVTFRLEQAEIAFSGSPPLGGSGRVVLDLDLIGSKAASPARMMTVTVINDVASY